MGRKNSDKKVKKLFHKYKSKRILQLNSATKKKGRKKKTKRLFQTKLNPQIKNQNERKPLINHS